MKRRRLWTAPCLKLVSSWFSSLPMSLTSRVSAKPKPGRSGTALEPLYSILAIDTPEGRKSAWRASGETSVDALYLGYAKYSNGACNWMSRHQRSGCCAESSTTPPWPEDYRCHQEESYLLAVFGMGFRDVDDLSRTEFVVPFDDERRLVCAVEMASKKRSIKVTHTQTRRR